MKTAVHVSQSVVVAYRYSDKLTNSQIWHIQLPQLHLLSTTQRAPRQVLGDARRGRNGRLTRVNEEVERDAWVVWRILPCH